MKKADTSEKSTVSILGGGGDGNYLPLRILELFTDDKPKNWLRCEIKGPYGSIEADMPQKDGLWSCASGEELNDTEIGLLINHIKAGQDWLEAESLCCAVNGQGEQLGDCAPAILAHTVTEAAIGHLEIKRGQAISRVLSVVKKDTREVVNMMLRLKNEDQRHSSSGMGGAFLYKWR